MLAGRRWAWTKNDLIQGMIRHQQRSEDEVVDKRLGVHQPSKLNLKLEVIIATALEGWFRVRVWKSPIIGRRKEVTLAITSILH
jgi:hypothetical protein